MISTVKRFDLLHLTDGLGEPFSDICENDEGIYVLFEDFDALSVENTCLRAALDWCLRNQIVVADGDLVQHDGGLSVGFGGWCKHDPIPDNLTEIIQSARLRANNQKEDTLCGL